MTSKTTKNQSKINHKVNSTAQQPQYRKTNKFCDSSTFFIDFKYSSLGMLRSKINKNGAKIPSKRSVKSTPTCIDFGTNLAPFWEGFGSQVGTKSLPKSMHKDIKKMITFWIALGTDFGLQHGPVGGEKRVPFWASFSLLGPS